MRSRNFWTALLGLTSLAFLGIEVSRAQVTNRPPKVSIAWPTDGNAFRAGLLIKLEADAIDLDGSIAHVEFFANTNLIGSVTNAPFQVVWPLAFGGGAGGVWSLTAIATDNSGAMAQSPPVRVFYLTGRPPTPVLNIVSPRDRSLLPAPASFELTAELLASSGDSGPVDFYVGTNLVQRIDRNEPFTASTPLYSITVSNLVEGTYELRAKYMGGDWSECFCRPITISVVKLGVQLPSLTPDGHLQFDVVTSFPGKPVVTEASINLRDWISVSTNVPASNSFHFIDPSPPTPSARFYRVVVPQG